MNTIHGAETLFADMFARVMTTNVVIADDHSLVRAGLRSLLEAEPDLEVVGEAGDGSCAIRITLETQPDVLVTDISMPGPNGIAVVRQIRERLPDTRVLLLSMHEDAALVREAREAGAAGYVTKRAGLADLVRAVRTVAAGGTYFDPALSRPAAGDLFDNAMVATPAVESLTLEELGLLRMLALGYTMNQVAGDLGVDQGTALDLRAGLSEKLGLRSRVELLRYAKEQGLLAD